MAHRRRRLLVLGALLLPVVTACAAPRIANYDISATIEPESRWLRAAVRTDWETDVAADRLRFSLRPSLKITGLRGPEGAALEYNRDADGTVTLPLPAAMAAGARFSLILEYEGEIHGPLGGRSGRRVWDHIGSDGTYVRFEAEWYPMIWGDRATADVRLTVPQGWSAVTSGKLVSQEGRTFHWRIGHPTSGISFAAAQYSVSERLVGDLPLQCYLFGAHADRAEEFMSRCAEILAFYGEIYSPYPFEKFAIAEIPDLYGGGHGDQSFIMLQELTFTQPFDAEFVAHEMAHNWWGGILTCTESEFLIEAFPTYSQALWRERFQGRQAFTESMNRQAESVLMASWNPAEETSCYESDSGPLLYEKGAWILHMLRQLLGDEKWFSTVKAFVAGNQGRDVTCAQFQQACEQAYGDSLEWFFRQWLYGTGVPWVKARITGYDGKAATIALSQELVIGQERQGNDAQSVSWQTQPGGFFLPVEIALQCEGQQVRRRLWLTRSSQELRIDVPARPTAVVVDPDGWLLDHSKGLVGALDKEMAGLEAELERELGDLGAGVPR